MKAKKDYEYLRYLYEVRAVELEQIASEYSLTPSFLEKKAAREGWRRCDHGCLERLFEISDRLEDSIRQNLEGQVDLKNYKDLTAAIKDALAIRRNLYRLPTYSEESAQKIALEKLDLDRARYGSENSEHVLSVEFSRPDYCE